MITTKFCIFCGKPPSDKNREHIIPRWLIELTGDPKRHVRLGFKKAFRTKWSERQFAFDQFVFPACEICNTKYSALESKAKSTMLAIFDDKPVSSTEISTLLDWFDKVRVGLWLAFHLLDKNIYDIEPQFHIDRRIGQFDRLLIIERSKPEDRFLNITGTDSPAFTYTPCAFGISVNGWHFTNVSFSYLVARRLGFPFPRKVVMEARGTHAELVEGRNRVMHPVVQFPLPDRCVSIYQPMYKVGLVPHRSELYETDYVRQNSLDHQQGVGAVFIEQNGGVLQRLEPEATVQISTDAKFDNFEQLARMVVTTCKLQNWIDDEMYILGKMPPEDKRFIKSRRHLARRVNDILISHHEELIKKHQSELRILQHGRTNI
jgi:hypothetical protein